MWKRLLNVTVDQWIGSLYILIAGMTIFAGIFNIFPVDEQRTSAAVLLVGIGIFSLGSGLQYLFRDKKEKQQKEEQ